MGFRILLRFQLELDILHTLAPQPCFSAMACGVQCRAGSAKSVIFFCPSYLHCVAPWVRVRVWVRVSLHTLACAPQPCFSAMACGVQYRRLQCGQTRPNIVTFFTTHPRTPQLQTSRRPHNRWFQGRPPVREQRSEPRRALNTRFFRVSPFEKPLACPPLSSHNVNKPPFVPP